MQSPDRGQERARRRAARETLAAYHEQQLTLLLDHVRDGFAQMDAGALDAFDVDELIHRYPRSTRAVEVLRIQRRGVGNSRSDAGIPQRPE
ncbi:MAG: hypothetical protein M3Y49_19560 [Actinomycetota bacterium]|nr:hypothetical protein [Actinomycetota bacterium]